jgi:uncharacterized membrane protein
MIGIAVASAGPVCMALADTSSSALRSLLFGVFTACFFGGSNFMRKLVAKRGASNKSIVIILYLTIGFFAIVAMSYCSVSGRGLKGLSRPKLTAYASSSGVLWVLGGTFFQSALMGKAGPASAVTNTNSVGVLILSVIFYPVTVQPLKLVGMALCIAGVTALSLKPTPAARDVECQEFSTSLQQDPRHEEESVV